jgi:hypothetical protein
MRNRPAAPDFSSSGAAYDPLVLNDSTWRARVLRVLSGALGVWGIAGSVSPDPDVADGFVIAPGTGPALRVRHTAMEGWTVALRDPASGRPVEIGRHAGLPGLLRRLRDELAPDAAAGRLVVGTQRILGDAGTP